MRLWRRWVTQDEVIAWHMQRFFRSVRRSDRPEQVAKKYAAYFWDPEAAALRDMKSLGEQQFDVSLGFEGGDLASLTKRVALISDTLLLSDGRGGKYHEIGRSGGRYDVKGKRLDGKSDLSELAGVNWADVPPSMYAYREEPVKDWREDYFGIRTLDLAQLGTWILQAEPLLKTGLAWYLPDYCLRAQEVKKGRPVTGKPRPIHRARAVDFLIKGRRAIEATGDEPVKSRFVRPILEINLPFIDGVGLRDFSKITIEEFGSYQRFRTYLRGKFLDLDQAQDAVQSQEALTRIGLEIQERIHECRAEMAKIQRTRALAATGAVLGTTGATLTAVYGPALTAALGVVGAAGGLWSVVQAISQNNAQTIRDDKWYYVWSLEEAFGKERAKRFKSDHGKRSKKGY